MRLIDNKQLYVKQINKDLFYSTGYYIQYLLIAYKEKSLKLYTWNEHVFNIITQLQSTKIYIYRESTVLGTKYQQAYFLGLYELNIIMNSEQWIKYRQYQKNNDCIFSKVIVGEVLTKWLL